MATIKDIAKISGVSQGTVSNVLNGKGNVSSEKIRLVEAAAASLGYAINERAKVLRQGKSKILAIILPNIKFKQYVDFYLSFVSFAESKGYTTLLYLSNDNPETEREMIRRARSGMASGLAAFPILSSRHRDYREAGFDESAVLFVERDQDAKCNYLGFDYAKCGRKLAEQALSSEMKSVALVTDNLEFSNQRAFQAAFLETLGDTPGMRISQIHTDLLRRNQSTMQLFEPGCPDGVFVANFGFAETVRNLLMTFFRRAETKIYTVSPNFMMPEGNFIKYELNYRLMGKKAAELLISHIGHNAKGNRVILENSGFREWAAPTFRSEGKCLNLHTLDRPEDSAM